MRPQCDPSYPIPGGSPLDLRAVKELGTSGVGLCRLEHVLAASGETTPRRQALARSRRAVAKRGLSTDIRILVPMVGFSEEFRRVRQVIEDVFARETPGAQACPPAVGCLIEVLRIALNAADLAGHADFLSIGSNDLTQFTLAASRDDAEIGFLGSYLRDQVITTDPFEHLDRVGVGRLVRLCLDEARARRPEIPIGLCGEHAGDPASVEYLVFLGVDSLSCSPRRVPLTRFSAGRAALLRSTVSSG
ncbi:MAG: putative PEP-binding protein [Pseudonocardiaceae bacterium]